MHGSLQLRPRRIQGGARVALLVRAQAAFCPQPKPILHASEHVVVAPHRAHAVVAAQDNVEYLGKNVDAAETVVAQTDAGQLCACEQAGQAHCVACVGDVQQRFKKIRDATVAPAIARNDSGKPRGISTVDRKGSEWGSP